jgi:DNA-binding CsgD family transcriptional regulator
VARRSKLIVGRDNEFRQVRDAVTAARAGRGGALFFVGEGGIGKSRLAAAAADLGFETGMQVLRGRGSAIGPIVPYRSLTEALLSLLRSGDPIDVTALGPYRLALARLVPDWGEPTAEADGESLVILAEAVLRLIGLAGRHRGCMVTLDDLQDTDPETLAVLEYLIDNLGQQPTLLVGALRDDPSPALELARSAAQRGTGTLIELNRLTRAEVDLLVVECLGARPEDVPETVAELLWAGGMGNPFRTEELLGGMADGGLLVRGPDGGWVVVERLLADLPASLTRSVTRRIDLLSPPAREVLTMAAVLGCQFPLAVLRVATGTEYRDLLNHLHGERAAQFVVPDDETPDRYVFRHALLREAVLTLVTPAERPDLARRVANAVETVYPELPGEWCQVCAGLWLDAGEPTVAGRLFAEAGRRALAQGAAHSAVTLLDKAWELLQSDVPARVDALEARLLALTEAGQVSRALATAETFDELSAGLDRRRRAQLHTRLAWAANISGRTVEGLNQVEIARALLGPDAAAEDTAPLDIVAAHLELDVPGPDRMRKAEAMARRVAKVAEAVPLPVVACQAWQMLGALARTRDPDEATACLERSRSIAVRHGLPIWELHALVRLGNDSALRDGSIARLEQVRQQASRVGAIDARYWAEASIALYQILRGDFAAAEALTDEVLAVSTRLRLLQLTQYLLVNRAILAGHRGRRADMDAALAELRSWEDGDQEYSTPRVHGLAKAFCALLEEDRALATEELATALHAEKRNPTIFLMVGRQGLNLLLRALSGDLDWAEYEAVTEDPAGRLLWDRQFAVCARAVLTGRSGHADKATEAVAEALRIGEPYGMSRHLCLRLVAEAALADGWGTPVEWLRTAEEYFHVLDVPPVAGECRRLLRGTGFRVAPRRNGIDEVPSQLRSAGVTVREYEVLRLLVERLGNREIADRLHLSLRTVEKHVSSLIAKTGLPNRRALGKLAALTTDQ